MRTVLPALAALVLTGADAAVPPPADPATVKLHVEDADRFAAVFAAAKGIPSVADLQTGYLDPGSHGVTAFTPGRIEDATRLSAYVAKHACRAARKPAHLPCARDGSYVAARARADRRQPAARTGAGGGGGFGRSDRSRGGAE